MSDGGLSEQLLRALADARARGFLGPGPLEDHIRHAAAFGPLLPDHGGPFLDLGSGGGVPGLVLAELLPGSRWTLLDAAERRVGFLREVVVTLGLGARVTPVRARAEDFARTDARGTFAAVVSRGFAGPATTAECAAGLLQEGAVLIVSEPPEHRPRWDGDGLDRLGLRVGVRTADPALQVLHQDVACPDMYPRRNGVPTKRPLF